MKNINDIIISEHYSLREAMELMTRSRKGILLVLNEVNQLVGILSDGDVRRAILNKALMISPVSQLMNTDPIVENTVDAAIKLLVSKSLVIVPVVDKSKHLLAVVTEEGGAPKVFEMLQKPTNLHSERSMLIIIPARGGSKRIPHKNLQKVGGYSLVSRAISTAQEAFKNAHIVVSTDDPQIAKEAERMGVEVPWLRPSHLAMDKTSSFDVIDHALQWAIGSVLEKIDTVVLLEPTAPLRKSFHLVEALNILRSSNADSVVGVCEVPHVFHPDEILSIDNGLLKPFKMDKQMHTRALRDMQQKQYVQNGVVYMFKSETILKKRNMYGDTVVPYLVEWKYFADIDEPIDLITAEAKLKILT